MLGLRPHADVAQLVEHNLAKVGVAGSNPVVRSKSYRRSGHLLGALLRITMVCKPPRRSTVTNTRRQLRRDLIQGVFRLRSRLGRIEAERTRLVRPQD